jgi:hypothetical protein
MDRAPRILIQTFVGDAHAAAVAAQLRRSGVPCDLWYSNLYPAQQQITFRANAGEYTYRICDGTLTADISQYSSIWYRRPTPPVCQGLQIHDADREYVSLQARTFFRMSIPVLAGQFAASPSTRVINNIAAGFRAESKLLQIAVAGEVGFNVPDTLISNEPEEIRSFVDGKHPVICKSLYPYGWEENGDAFVNACARVKPQDLPSDAMLRASPEIFQVEIPRRRELRLFIAGSFAVGVEIMPSSSDEVDWRLYHTSADATRPLRSIPHELEGRCRSLMDKLDLVTASIDVLEDDSGEIYFADLNQAGQFLWMEDFGVPVLDGFCRFLTGKDNCSDAAPVAIGLEQIHQTAEFIELQNLETQLPVPPAGSFGST